MPTNAKGVASPGKFTPDRYTIKVLSDTQRLITKMVGETAGIATLYDCKRTFGPEQLVCADESIAEAAHVTALRAGGGYVPWAFYRNTYTRAFLFGPPAGAPRDANIWIARWVWR
jgi:hypothetical protein